MDDRKKRRKSEIQKFEYLENEKSFLDEQKTFFIVFKGYHLVKNKHFIKIADTSFTEV